MAFSVVVPTVGKELAYAEITTAFNETTTASTDITGLTIDVVGTGQPIMLELWARSVFPNGGASRCHLALYEGATLLADSRTNITATLLTEQMIAKRRLAGFSTTRTFKGVVLSESVANITVDADATYPAFIRAVSC